ncbi:hypothetical protein Bbelb_356920 [Branchiostoma belcheri]|nr:hypothetical protein Bbelb_356920 [Branchiostoma belcheri]
MSVVHSATDQGRFFQRCAKLQHGNFSKNVTECVGKKRASESVLGERCQCHLWPVSTLKVKSHEETAAKKVLWQPDVNRRKGRPNLKKTLHDEVGLNDRDLPAAMLDRNQKCSCRQFIVLLHESGSVRALADPVIVLRITPRTLGELRTTPDRTLGVTT